MVNNMIGNLIQQKVPQLTFCRLANHKQVVLTVIRDSANSLTDMAFLDSSVNMHTRSSEQILQTGDKLSCLLSCLFLYLTNGTLCEAPEGKRIEI